MGTKKASSLNARKHTWLRHTLASRMKSTFVIPAMGAALMMTAPMIANAADIHVTDETSLRNAITSAVTGDTIIFDNDITITSDLPPITESVTIDGFNGTSHTLNANGYRSLYVDASANPNVQNLTVTNGGSSGIYSNATSTNILGFPNTSITLNGSTTFNGSAEVGNSGDGNGNTEFNAHNTGNTVTGGISLYNKSTVNILGLESGPDVTQANSLTSNIQIKSGDASVSIGGGLFNLNSGNNTSSITNTLTGSVNGDSGVGGSVYVGSGIGNNNSSGTSTNETTDTLNGSVTLDGATSYVSVGSGGIADGAFFGNSSSDSTNTVKATITGNVTLTNGGTVYLGRDGDDDTITVDDSNGSLSVNTIINKINGNVAVTNGNLTLNGGSFTVTEDDSNVLNSVTNEIGQNVTVTNGDVNLNGGSFTVTEDVPDAVVNWVTNKVDGTLTINDNGNLNFNGDTNTADDTSNKSTNEIVGLTKLNGAADSLVKGANNKIDGGLELNTTTYLETVGGSNEHNDVTKLIIGGGDTANSITGNVLNSLYVGGSGVVVNANPYSNSNSYNDYQRSNDHGYDIDSGHVYVGAYGGSNSAANGVNITNQLDGSVTLNGYYGGAGSLLNSGGMVIVGAADNNLTDGSTVINEITGGVTLNGGSRLHLGGDSFTGDANVGNSVTNKVDGAVTAGGNSFVAMWGEDDTRLHNILGSTLTLNDSALFHAEGVDNTVTGGVTLYDSAIAQLGGSGGAHTRTNNLAANFSLYNNSQLQLGSNYEYSNNATITDIVNHIQGNVTLNDDARLKVLSGGSGGTNSVAGTSNISGNLTLGNNNTFIVNAGINPNITGLRVDGAGGAQLGNANVQVDLFNTAMNFGQRYSLVEAVNGVHGIFNPDVITADSNGELLDTPFLLWQTGYTSTSAYLTLLTQFNNAEETDNQRRFGQYLDNLVADSGAGGITDTLDDNDLYDTLQYLAYQSDPNALNDFTGDTYAAFDLAGYWNANRFSNRVALHALQSRDSDWVQSFALNASQGLSGATSQMSLVKQLLNSRPAVQLAANNPALFNDSSRANSGVWGDIAGDWLSNDTDSSIGSPDFDLNSKSVILGYQSGSQKFTWGIAGGYHDGNLDFNNRDASGDINGWNIGLNGLWKGNSGVYLNGVLAYNTNSNSLTRDGGIGTNESDFNSHSISAQLELGKKFNHRNNVSFTPYLSLLALKYNRDSVSEHGSGAGLDVGDASNSYFTSNLGVRVGKDFFDDNGSKRGGVMLGVSWQHQFSDVDFPVTAALQNAAPGSSFTVQGTPLSKNGIGVQLGGYGRLNKNILGFLNYSGSFSSNQKVNSVTAGVEYQF